jgi:hypothetical protein
MTVGDYVRLIEDPERLKHDYLSNSYCGTQGVITRIERNALDPGPARAPDYNRALATILYVYTPDGTVWTRAEHVVPIPVPVRCEHFSYLRNGYEYTVCYDCKLVWRADAHDA